MKTGLLAMAALLGFNGVATVAVIGQPRSPITPALAAATVAADAVMVTILVTAYRRL